MSSTIKSSRISRRQFGVRVAAGAALTLPGADRSLHGNPQPPDYVPPPRPLVPEVPPFSGPLEFTPKRVLACVEPFPMSQVRLLPGTVFHDAQEWNREYMARLAPQRLLYTFRVNAGLPVGSATPLGGWEQPENGKRSSELRGHFVGHFLSASALLYASTGATDVKSQADSMVAELAKCQQRLGGTYLSAFPKTWWDRLETGQRVWAPFYTIHKIMAGMFEMYRLAGNNQALQVLERMAAWTDAWTAPKTDEHMQQILAVEFGGIAETLYNLAAATGNNRWAIVGDRFQKKSFINPLALRRDELRGLHANTHIPQAIAAARRYEISSHTRFRNVADYFFHEVSDARSYVTGGTSNAEGWLSPPRQLASEWKASANTCECCCAYNMLKLSRHLYSWEPQARYFDYYEHLLLNHRIGTIRPNVGTTQYYLSLTPGVWKTFATEDQTFWCCNGTGIEEYAKLTDSIYWHDGEGVYVNLFIASELDWKEEGFKLRQDTTYPESENTLLTIVNAPGRPLPIRLRIPGWLRSSPVVKLNGQRLEASATPGSCLTLTRAWKAGDRVEMDLPMHLRVEAMPDEPQTQAFLYGPLVLAGDLGNDGLTEAHIVGPNLRVGAAGVEQHGSPLGAVNQTPPVPAVEIPTFRATGSDPSSWIRAADQPRTFRTVGQKKDVTLLPLYRLFDKRYSVYWQIA